MGHGSLDEFAHHGILPFVGRESQQERLLRFWNGTLTAHGLQAWLLLGERGTGKSRLVQEITADIDRIGGIVVHVRLHPDVTTSIVPPMLYWLRTTAQGRGLLKSEPDPSNRGIGAALQRIARIRPTLLVFEDVHLLSGDAVAEFSELLEMLADEQLTVVCTAWPIEFPARPALDEFPLETIVLRGLNEAAVARLWAELFAPSSSPNVSTLLHESTQGNPLALRNVFRSILKLRKSLPPEEMPLTRESPALVRTIADNVRVFSESMSVHLEPSELAAAQRLSILGTVFAHEAASAMLERAGMSLRSLVEKGIVVRTILPATSLTGRSDGGPILAFNHTLLHRHFLDQADVRADEVLEIIAAQTPLHSILPFELLRQRVASVSTDAETIARGIACSLHVASALDATSNWEAGMPVWHTARELFETHNRKWPLPQRHRIEAELLHIELAISRRNDASPEFAARAEQLLELADRLGDERTRYRMLALTHLQRYAWRRDYDRCRRIAEEMQALIDPTPRLRFTKEYIFYLENAAGAALTYEDIERIREIEREMEDLLASPEIDDEFRRIVRLRIGIHFIPVFENHEELERRFRLIEKLEAESQGIDEYIEMMKISVDESIGEADRLIEACDRMIPRFREQGMFRSYHNAILLRLCGQGAIGMDPRTLRIHAEAIGEDAPVALQPRLRYNTAINLAAVYILRNLPELAREIRQTVLESPAELPPAARFILAPDETTMTETAREFSLDDAPPFARMLAALTLNDLSLVDDRIVEDTLALLGKPILRYPDIITTLAVADVLRRTEKTAGNDPIRNRLRAALVAAFPQALQWLAARNLSGFLAGVLAQALPFLSSSQEKEWRGVAARLAEQRESRLAPQNCRCGARISVLGRITVAPSEGSPEIVRGARLRTVLGFLVAVEMLDDEPAEVEFHRIAAPNAADAEHARKSINMTVYGLRALLGNDAIVTRETGPRLDLRYCSVDLLEANSALLNVEKALRQRSLARAYALISTALELTGGDVPFPALYDSLFESVRDEFENRLRSAVIAVATTLLQEGDLQRAEELLRRAYAALRDDEEILMLLCDALNRLDKRIEAERLRLQASIG